MNEEQKQEIKERLANAPGARLSNLLGALGVPPSTWYRRSVPVDERRKPGPAPSPITKDKATMIEVIAISRPVYGYKKIAIVCRRFDATVTNREVYKVMKAGGLLRKKRKRAVELYQSSKLYELLPKAPNELWQMDVTYVHIPGYGWRYVITVIDYYSRYLLAAHFTWSYSAAEALKALDKARCEAERIHGPLKKTPFLVTDNGSSFIAGRFTAHVAGLYTHVRIQYRTPTQLGLLERFHKTFKEEEVYYRLYKNPEDARRSIAKYKEIYNHDRPHWALAPAKGGDHLTPMDVYLRGAEIKIPKWQGWAKGAKEKLDKMLEEDKKVA